MGGREPRASPETITGRRWRAKSMSPPSSAKPRASGELSLGRLLGARLGRARPSIPATAGRDRVRAGHAIPPRVRGARQCRRGTADLIEAVVLVPVGRGGSDLRGTRHGGGSRADLRGGSAPEGGREDRREGRTVLPPARPHRTRIAVPGGVNGDLPRAGFRAPTRATRFRSLYGGAEERGRGGVRVGQSDGGPGPLRGAHEDVRAAQVAFGKR